MGGENKSNVIIGQQKTKHVIIGHDLDIQNYSCFQP